MGSLFGGGKPKGPSLAQKTQDFYLQQQQAATQGQAAATASAQADLAKAGAPQSSQPLSLKDQITGVQKQNGAGGFFGLLGNLSSGSTLG